MRFKNLLYSLSISLISYVGASQNTAIPDANFEQALIDLGYDNGAINGVVATANINTITTLDVSGKNIADLTGIEDFTALTILNCENNVLINLNIASNKGLIELFCNDNNMTSLDVTQLTNLSILWCSNNFITSLDISQNPNIISLLCEQNELTVLDVSQNTILNTLLINNNRIVNINLTNNPLLRIFICHNNPLPSIDVSTNLELTTLDCGITLITNLNVSQNLKLDTLICNSAFLTNLNLTNNINLTSLNCSNNQITDLILPNTNSLVSIKCNSNQIPNIDVSRNTNLVQLICDNNKLSDIDITLNTDLELLFCFSNLLTDIDLLSNSKLIELSCQTNLLTTLDLKNNRNLTVLFASFNPLCKLDIRNGRNTNITNFNVNNTPNLNCIYVDDIVYSTVNWTNIDATTNFVTNDTECNAFGNLKPPVDILDNVVTNSGYTLQTLNNGVYYTQSSGNGLTLSAGDFINTSQTIYIYNETICSSNESNFTIIISEKEYFIPSYFTPNNDGRNDFWKVSDSSNSVRSVSIFNRYGKLLKSLNPNSEGWNGTFNGQLMPTDDYWFRITLNSGDITTGHFALKR